jgi:hypothetical protein
MMSRTVTMLDEKGYCQRQQDIDAAILNALEEGGKTHMELCALLRSTGVGNARSDDQLELSYSMTGAILRAAVNSLRSRGLIYDSWDFGRHYPKPFRFFKAGKAA